MKRILGVLTTLLLAVGVLAVPTTAQAAPTMTQPQLTADVKAFANAYEGDYIDFDGVYGAQCVDLLKEWLEYEYGVTVGAMGNAEAWWNRYSSNSVLKSLFTQVSKTATPQPGWIAVYQGGYADATAGHIALVTGANYTATTSVYGSNLYMNRVFQQNAPKLGQASNSSYFPVASLLGYLAPKNVTAAVVGATAKLVDTGWSRSTPTKTGQWINMWATVRPHGSRVAVQKWQGGKWVTITSMVTSNSGYAKTRVWVRKGAQIRFVAYAKKSAYTSAFTPIR